MHILDDFEHLHDLHEVEVVVDVDDRHILIYFGDKSEFGVQHRQNDLVGLHLLIYQDIH